MADGVRKPEIDLIVQVNLILISLAKQRPIPIFASQTIAGRAAGQMIKPRKTTLSQATRQSKN